MALCFAFILILKYYLAKRKYHIYDFEFLDNGNDDFIIGANGKFYISDWSQKDITIKSEYNLTDFKSEFSAITKLEFNGNNYIFSEINQHIIIQLINANLVPS